MYRHPFGFALMRIGWWVARFPFCGLLVLVGVWAALYMGWFVTFDGPWSTGTSPRFVLLAELVPVFGGCVGLAAVAPRLRWLEMQSPRPTARLDLAAVLAVVVAFSFSGLIARLAWELGPGYTQFVPPSWTLADFSLRGEVAPLGLFLVFGAEVMVVLSCVVMTIALAGHIIGCLSGVVWFALLLTVDSRSGLGLFDASSTPPDRRGLAVVLAFVMLGAAASLYAAFVADGGPLLTRVRSALFS